jgi:ATP-binding cassette subfamily B protein
MLKKLRLLFGYMRGNRLLYAGAIICVGLSAVAAMIPTLIVRFTVDSLIGDQPAQLPRILLGLIDRIGGLEF